MTQKCAWTGEEFDGKGYVIQTTEGQEVVSADAMHTGPWEGIARTRDIVQELSDTVAALAARVQELEKAERARQAEARAARSRKARGGE